MSRQSNRILCCRWYEG